MFDFYLFTFISTFNFTNLFHIYINPYSSHSYILLHYLLKKKGKNKYIYHKQT